MKKLFVRGSAMPETALVMSAVLLVFLGLIKLADVGYQQSETDAAAFVAAREGSLASTGNQQTYGQNTAKSVFGAGHFSGANGNAITVHPGVSATPNPAGDVVGYATHSSGGLWLSQAFGGSGVFNLHAFFVEPTASTPYVAGASSFSVQQANPPNCTTHNVATPTCSDLSASFATPNPSNTADPFYAYACHAMYYAVLSNSSGFSPDATRYFAPWISDLLAYDASGAINYVLPDSASLSALTDQNGNLLTGSSGQQPWPLDFQPTAPDGINNASNRSSGTWLTTQYEPNGVTPDPANADGKSTKGGNLGRALLPIFNFGGVGGKC